MTLPITRFVREAAEAAAVVIAIGAIILLFLLFVAARDGSDMALRIGGIMALCVGGMIGIAAFCGSCSFLKRIAENSPSATLRASALCILSALYGVMMIAVAWLLWNYLTDWMWHRDFYCETPGCRYD